jgi:hypothetical protein
MEEKSTHATQLMVEKTAIIGIVSPPMFMPPFASFTLYNAAGAGWLTGNTQIQDKRIPVLVFGDWRRR